MTKRIPLLPLPFGERVGVRGCAKRHVAHLDTPAHSKRSSFRRRPESSLNMRPKDKMSFMLGASHAVLKLDSSLLKAKHIHVLSPRAGLRRNDGTARKGLAVAGKYLALATLLLFTATAHASKDHPVIGFSIDDLRLERWAHDRDYFVAAATKLGAKVYVQSADASEERQVAQLENLIAREVDVLVIVPFNSKVLSNVVAEAERNGIKVVSYDRLILNANVDAYITFDNERVGELQAQGVLNRAPKGNYFLLGGSPTDNNAKIIRQGQMKVLQPAIDSGAVKIVGQQWTPDWDASKALRIVEDALTANANNIQGVVASNDGTAGGAIQALAAQGLAGKVPVSGQDADLAAVKRVIDGTQAMTVYKPIKQLATRAAELSVALVRDEQPKYTTTLNNGAKNVDTVLLDPVLLTQQNVDVVIHDGFYTHAQIYGK